jgi:hypothetical protein
MREVCETYCAVGRALHAQIAYVKEISMRLVGPGSARVVRYFPEGALADDFCGSLWEK